MFVSELEIFISDGFFNVFEIVKRDYNRMKYVNVYVLTGDETRLNKSILIKAIVTRSRK